MDKIYQGLTERETPNTWSVFQAPQNAEKGEMVPITVLETQNHTKHWTCTQKDVHVQVNRNIHAAPSIRGMFARRTTFLLTIPTSAGDLSSDGEGPPNRP